KVRLSKRSSATVSPTPASHRRLIRRRLLSQISAPSPPLLMKKKKPKKSPTKSPPKSSPVTKSNPDANDLPTPGTKIVSDAQFGCLTVPVAQQLQDSSDLASVQSDIPTCVKTLRSSVETSDDATVSIDKRSSDVNVQAATADATVVTLSSLAADAKVDSLSPIAADIFPSPSTGADVGGKDEAPPATSAAEVEKNSVSEPNPNQANCPKKQKNELNGRKTRRGRSKVKQAWKEVDKVAAGKSPLPPSQTNLTVPVHSELVQTELHKSQLGTAKDKVVGESSNPPFYLLPVSARSRSGASGSSRSDVQPDSSDVESSDSDLEEGELSKHDLELGFQ
ncbi:hypothetical protein IGI04_010061, partial [Brassica rapa subsp. trilocularis]